MLGWRAFVVTDLKTIQTFCPMLSRFDIMLKYLFCNCWQSKQTDRHKKNWQTNRDKKKDKNRKRNGKKDKHTNKVKTVRKGRIPATIIGRKTNQQTNKNIRERKSEQLKENVLKIFSGEKQRKIKKWQIIIQID